MPKVYENEVVYNYPPPHTLLWLMRKYPNPFATHVNSVDTIARTIDPTTGVVRTERIVGVQQGAPKWITKERLQATRGVMTFDLPQDTDTVLFQLPETAYVREVIFIDPGQDSATMMSMNLNLAQYVNCLEHITYTPHPATGGASAPSTLFKQNALMVSGFPTALIARRIEKASVDRFKSNAAVGRQGFDWVLQRGLGVSESQSPRV